MTEIQNYAILDGEIEFIENYHHLPLDSIRKMDWRHPYDGTKMIPHLGDIRVWHFQSESEGESYGISLEHYMGQRFIMEYYRKLGCNVRMEVSERTESGQLRRADINVTFPNGNRFIIEVQRSDISNTEVIQRTKDWQSLGYGVIWVTVDRRVVIDDRYCGQIFNYDSETDYMDCSLLMKSVWLDIEVFDLVCGYPHEPFMLIERRVGLALRSAKYKYTFMFKNIFRQFNFNFRSLKDIRIGRMKERRDEYLNSLERIYLSEKPIMLTPTGVTLLQQNNGWDIKYAVIVNHNDEEKLLCHNEFSLRKLIQIPNRNSYISVYNTGYKGLHIIHYDEDTLNTLVSELETNQLEKAERQLIREKEERIRLEKEKEGQLIREEKEKTRRDNERILQEETQRRNAKEEWKLRHFRKYVVESDKLKDINRDFSLIKGEINRTPAPNDKLEKLNIEARRLYCEQNLQKEIINHAWKRVDYTPKGYQRKG